MHYSYLFAYKQLNFVSKLKLFCNFVERSYEKSVIYWK